MNKRSYLLAAVILMTFLTPAFAAPDKLSSKFPQSWVGSDINDLIDSWGPPSQQYRMPNGNMLISFTTTRSLPEPLFIFDSGLGNAIALGGETITRSCTTTFSVQPNGRIYSWKYSGNDCPK